MFGYSRVEELIVKNAEIVDVCITASVSVSESLHPYYILIYFRAILNSLKLQSLVHIQILNTI